MQIFCANPAPRSALYPMGQVHFEKENAMKWKVSIAVAAVCVCTAAWFGSGYLSADSGGAAYGFSVADEKPAATVSCREDLYPANPR